MLSKGQDEHCLVNKVAAFCMASVVRDYSFSP